MIEIKALANLLLASNNAVALTGAGMSTDSGIPDFRSDTGVWNKLNPELISIDTLTENPDVFYRHFKLFAKTAEGKVPNKGHFLLAELEKLGFIKRVVTQNVDGFHSLAGSKDVLEMHGNFKNALCMKCGRIYHYGLIQRELDKENYCPKSPCCGATLRPSVVLFGDNLPITYHRFANEEIFNVDFLLIIGTSLEVYPAAYLPDRIRRYAIINKSKTGKDNGARVVIHDSISDTLEKLVKELKRILPGEQGKDSAATK